MPSTNDNNIQNNKRMDGFTLRTLVCCVVLFITFMISTANAASTSIRVSARILPWLEVSAVPQVSSYQVDAAAIQRGYVDLPGSLSIRMATNLREEIDLNLSSFGPGRVLVDNGSFPGADIIQMEGLNSTQPVTRNFNLRVMLPANMEQGDYPLHLNVAAVNI